MGRTDLKNLDQEAELEHIRKCKLPGSSGARVAKDLQSFPELWDAAWMESSKTKGSWSDPDWLPDMLFIRTSDKDHASRLLEIFHYGWWEKGLVARQEANNVWILSGRWASTYSIGGRRD